MAEPDPVGRDDVGRDDVGRDDVGRDDVGRDDVGPDDVGPDDVGPDDVGEVVQAQLLAVRERPVGEHVAAYDRVDRLLRGALADLDEG